MCFRLKKLRIFIEKSHREIISSHILYKFLIDATEQTKGVFDYLVSVLQIDDHEIFKILIKTLIIDNLFLVCVYVDCKSARNHPHNP